MESQAVSKIIEAAKRRNLKVKIMRDLIDATVFHCEIKGCERAKGFGSADSSNLSLIKAYAEYIEREAFWSKCQTMRGSTSSGFAAHWDTQTAMKNASQELIERDAFLCSWFAQKSPYWLTDRDLDKLNAADLTEKRRVFRKKGYCVDFGVAGLNDKTFVVVGRFSSLQESFGFALDASASYSIAAAARKVYRTICYFYSFLAKRMERGEPLFDSNLQSVKSVDDHFEYFLAPFRKPKWFFESSDEICVYEPFEISVEIVHQCPDTAMYVAHATSPFCQNYFSGETTQDKVNMKRLREVFPSIGAFSLTLHPLA